MASRLSTLVIALALLAGCGPSPSSYAEEVCECAMEVGLEENGLELESFLESACMEDVLERLKATLSELNNEKRTEFLQSFLSELLETPCADIGFSAIEDSDINRMMRFLPD